jgi:hypothetical protein
MCNLFTGVTALLYTEPSLGQFPRTLHEHAANGWGGGQLDTSQVCRIKQSKAIPVNRSKGLKRCQGSHIVYTTGSKTAVRLSVLHTDRAWPLDRSSGTYVKGWVNPRAMVQLEVLMWKQFSNLLACIIVLSTIYASTWPTSHISYRYRGGTLQLQD